MAIGVHRAYVQMGYMYWRRQTAHASDRSRSSSVTVSACTVTRLPKLELLSRVPTNGKRAVPAARTYAVLLLPKFEIYREIRGCQPNESGTCARLPSKFAHFTAKWCGCLYLMGTHGGEMYLSWRMGSPSHLQAPGKLIVVGSKKGVWLK